MDVMPQGPTNHGELPRRPLSYPPTLLASQRKGYSGKFLPAYRRQAVEEGLEGRAAP